MIFSHLLAPRDHAEVRMANPVVGLRNRVLKYFNPNKNGQAVTTITVVSTKKINNMFKQSVYNARLFQSMRYKFYESYVSRRFQVWWYDDPMYKRTCQ